MKTRYVAFIIRIRLADADPGLPGSSAVKGTLQQAGASSMQPFNGLDHLIELLRGAIAAAHANVAHANIAHANIAQEPGKPDRSK